MNNNKIDISDIILFLRQRFGKNISSEPKKAKFSGFLKLLIPLCLIYWLILALNNDFILNIKLGLFTFLLPVMVSLIIYGVLRLNKKYIFTGIGILIFYLILVIIFSPLISTKAQRNLIGSVSEVNFSDQIQPVDLNQLPVVDQALAQTLADKKLGSIQGLGSQVTVGTMTLQSVNGKLVYVGALEPSSFIKWLFNDGTPGYVVVSATNPNDTKLVTELNGKPLKLKYLQSGYILDNIQRWAYLKDPTCGHMDFTFELDDSGVPYWVVTRYTAAIGIDEQKVIGTEIINAETGETKVYNVQDTPKWVDRIQPKDIITRHLNKWGELVHGIFNFSGRDKLKTTDGMSMIYNNGECYFYTGLTSVGSDQSLVGFTLTNTRTGKTIMYKTSGATEEAAMKSAEGKVQQFGYKATFPYLINIQNQPTYFMTLQDNTGLVKQYAMVNVKNYSTVAVGTTLQQTLNSYLEDISNNNMSLQGSDKGHSTISGDISRIGLVVSNGNSTYEVKLNNSDKVFSVPTSTSKDVAITNVGDKVKIDYINIGDNRYMLVNGFLNETLTPNAKLKVKKDQPS
ncbi:MAG: cell shape-determining protein [Clostridium sp.]|uniref:cell shape-determining protein n=1 Tax=Clostridium sp. TaxID=1506 RepID=UPI003F3529F3